MTTHARDLCAGGFGESPVILEAIKKAVGAGVSVVCPPHASLAVLDGAIRYALHPERIKARVMQKTYGGRISSRFDWHTHDVSQTLLRRKEVGLIACL